MARNSDDLKQEAAAIKEVGEVSEQATAGMGKLAGSTSIVVGLLTEMGTTVNQLKKNPVLTYAFFDKFGHGIQRGVIQKLSKSNALLRENQQEVMKTAASYNKWVTVLSTAAFQLSQVQLTMRTTGMEMNKYMGGAGFSPERQFERSREMRYQLADARMKYGADYAKALEKGYQSIAVYGGFNQLGEQERNALLQLNAKMYNTFGIDVSGNAANFMKRYQGRPGVGLQAVSGVQWELAKRAEAGKGFKGATSMSVATTMGLAYYLMDNAKSPEEAFQAASFFAETMGESGIGVDLGTKLFKAKPLASDVAGRISATNMFGIDLKTRGDMSRVEFVKELQQSLRSEAFTKRTGIDFSKIGSIEELGVKQAGVGARFGATIGLSLQDMFELATLKDVNITSSLDKNTIALDKMTKSVTEEALSRDKDYQAMTRGQERLPGPLDQIAGFLEKVSNFLGGAAEDLGIDPNTMGWLGLGLAAAGSVGSTALAVKGVNKLAKKIPAVDNIAKKLGLAGAGGKAAGDAAASRRTAGGKSLRSNRPKVVEKIKGMGKGTSKLLGKIALPLALGAAAYDILDSMYSIDGDSTTRENLGKVSKSTIPAAAMFIPGVGLPASIALALSPEYDFSGVDTADLEEMKFAGETDADKIGNMMEYLGTSKSDRLKQVAKGIQNRKSQTKRMFAPDVTKTPGAIASDAAFNNLSDLQKDRIVAGATGGLSDLAAEKEPGRVDVVFYNSDGTRLGSAEAASGQQMMLRINLGGVLTSGGG